MQLETHMAGRKFLMIIDPVNGEAFIGLTIRI